MTVAEGGAYTVAAAVPPGTAQPAEPAAYPVEGADTVAAAELLGAEKQTVGMAAKPAEAGADAAGEPF